MNFTAKELSKKIIDKYVRRLPDDDCETTLTTMLEEWRIHHINKHINTVNLENATKIRKEKPVAKQDNPNIIRTTAWPRGI